MQVRRRRSCKRAGEGIGLNEVKDKEGKVGQPVSLNKKEKKRYPLASLGLFFVYTQNKG